MAVWRREDRAKTEVVSNGWTSGTSVRSKDGRKGYWYWYDVRGNVKWGQDWISKTKGGKR
jgi:hypothetical protein